MFSEVPLINIDTKDINVKIPALTTEDINKYSSYLKLRVEKNAKILEEWTDMLNRTLALCGTTSKAEAQNTIDKLTARKKQTTDEETKNAITSEIGDMQRIIALPESTTRQEM